MSVERAHFIELLERRLTLLGELAGELRSSTEALVGLDIDAMHQKVGEQERLCNELRSLDRGLDDLQRKCSAGLEPGDDSSLLLERMAQAQGEVRTLNRRHAALVRRSQRTLEAMMNFLHSASPTYADPRVGGRAAGGKR